MTIAEFTAYRQIWAAVSDHPDADAQALATTTGHALSTVYRALDYLRLMGYLWLIVPFTATDPQ